ncbi:MAG: glycoside hydrolase family 15 protein, partial [Candidatus Eremiobacteraeota bacterium]|nr:glycoside hydrolase family 15 protein [Candidatus Eremiobacteraeota bacterium]
MSRPIEELAVIGDTATAAIVTRDGCIPWLCMPRFDSGACFAALVGTDDDGMWSLAPQGDFRVVQHAYSDESLLLETVYETSDGAQVRVVDAMDPAGDTTRLMRLVVGVRGTVRMETRFRIRFDYGRVVPWIHRAPGALVAIAGPDGAALYTNVPLEGHDHEHTATFDVAEGERVGFELVYFPSYERQPGPSDLTRSLRRIDLFWREWARTCSYQGPDRALVMRSLLTLKVLTDAKTGAIAAAPTTSLPEQLGGVRNWDYRYCWLRDATFVLVALLNAGYEAEAFAWRGWLLRAAAGNPEAVQILYGLRGERRLPEFEAAWLAGYAGSRPVRI